MHPFENDFFFLPPSSFLPPLPFKYCVARGSSAISDFWSNRIPCLELEFKSHPFSPSLTSNLCPQKIIKHISWCHKTDEQSRLVVFGIFIHFQLFPSRSLPEVPDRILTTAEEIRNEKKKKSKFCKMDLRASSPRWATAV